jgi:hypothetical protein
MAVYPMRESKHHFVAQRTEEKNRKEVKSCKTCNEKLNKMRELNKTSSGRKIHRVASIASYRNARVRFGNSGRGVDA